MALMPGGGTRPDRFLDVGDCRIRLDRPLIERPSRTIYNQSYTADVGSVAEDMYTQDVSRTTYKYATKSWWKIIADARIGWDPSATGNIDIF